MMHRWLMGDPTIVPVVMFHSVGAENLDWIFNYISEPIVDFESKIRSLKEGGFNFITWPQLYSYMRGELQIDLPAILLTFDDGYLDNWVYVYPILKKYGAKGTIFVSSDFVDPSAYCRPTLEDLQAGRCKHEDLDIAGFLNWAEMREMENSGVMDIQSHAATHTWYFKGDRVVDFWAPGNKKYPWMAWNAHPERKAFYMREDQSALVRFGTPVYEYEKSLVVRRYIPSERIAEEMASYVDGKGGSGFFIRPAWREDLSREHVRLVDKYADDCRYESDEEMRQRKRDELMQSKLALETNINKSIEFICWPGGGYDQMTLDVAREVGYKAWTLGSSDQSAFRNIPGAQEDRVKRMGSSIRQVWRGKPLGFTTGGEFYCGVRRHQGSTFHKWAGWVLKAARIGRSMVRP